MAILKVDTISGIGTEGPVFEGDIEFTSQNFLTLPKGDTTQRGRGRGFYAIGFANPKILRRWPRITGLDLLQRSNSPVLV